MEDGNVEQSAGDGGESVPVPSKKKRLEGRIEQPSGGGNGILKSRQHGCQHDRGHNQIERQREQRCARTWLRGGRHTAAGADRAIASNTQIAATAPQTSPATISRARGAS